MSAQSVVQVSLFSLTAAAAGLILAGPASAATPPIAEGVYGETLTRSDGQISFATGIQVRWDCGPDCFRMADRPYRYNQASGRWQSDPIPGEVTCSDGTTRAGSGIWWTTNGVNFTGDWSLAQPCPGGPPARPTSVLAPE